MLCLLGKLWQHSKPAAVCAALGLLASIALDRIIVFDVKQVLAGRETISRFLKAQAEHCPLWPILWTMPVYLSLGMLLGHLWLARGELQEDACTALWAAFGWTFIGALVGRVLFGQT